MWRWTLGGDTGSSLQRATGRNLRLLARGEWDGFGVFVDALSRACSARFRFASSAWGLCSRSSSLFLPSSASILLRRCSVCGIYRVLHPVAFKALGRLFRPSVSVDHLLACTGMLCKRLVGHSKTDRLLVASLRRSHEGTRRERERRSAEMLSERAQV